MNKEKLIKILIIELFIIFFVRFQLFDELSIENKKLLDKGKEDDENYGKNQNEEKKGEGTSDKGENDENENKFDIFQIIEKGKNFMGSVKPYVNRKEQYYIDIFTKIAEIVECHRQLVEFQNQDADTQEDDNFDQIGILKAVKPYMKEDKQVIIDKFIKLHEGIQNLNEKMKKYDNENNKNNMIDKILDIFEAVKPIIPDDKQDMAEKIIKNIKLVEALNKAENIMNSKNNKDKNEQQNINKETDKNNMATLTSKKELIKGKDNLERINTPSNTADDENKKGTNKDDEKEIGINNKDNTIDNSQNNDVEANNIPLGLSPQQSAVVDNLKSMLTKEQQQFMYNMINYLKQQGTNNNVDKEKNDEKTIKNDDLDAGN
ncbi:hypothetical protein [Thermoanaerobacterium sp. RBIITD]|uniref:hypothetical protein n=1 Tax=Thermoanaerobacterium sp. RBIITD TaxID=1550240 RepID=UPI000BB983F7|nr:hypothetical protein [Thermoanaerobacterium sp. RBIITD]SNX53058.1 hypothetical protein SAMN05660242_0550 [Thermoanaerobacterium sp. RBIITD]